MRYFLKYLSKMHLPMALMLSVGALALWIPDFLATDAPIAALTATLSLSVLNALILTLLFYEIGVTRFVPGLPMLTYLMLCAAVPSIHTCWQAQLAILCYAPLVLILHHSHLDPDTQGKAFWGTLLILLTTLFFPSGIWLIPFFWIGFYVQQSLSLRTLLASLFAMLFFALYYAIAWYLTDYYGYRLTTTLPVLPTPSVVVWLGHVVSLSTLVKSLVILAVGIWSMVAVIIRLDHQSTRVRVFSILYMLLFVLTVLMTIWPTIGQNNIPLLIYAATMLVSVYFLQRETIYHGIGYILLMLAALVAAFL